MNEHTLQVWELASYVVTVIGLPYAIAMFAFDSYKERQLENEELYQALAEEYAKFGNLMIENADLQLMTGGVPDEKLNTEQKERKTVIFDMLVALFERAYILVYEEKMDKQTKRLWATWEDYIKFWCQREDFKRALPGLLVGEDADFSGYIRKTAGIN
ncbi:MAG: hypothetical protein ACAH80_06145 [Alphaproteobacteria bacterium]